jgi:hypothetical protein
MKTLTVAQFKAQFGHVVSERVPILVRKRKTPVGLWQPLDLKQLRAKQSEVLSGFVKLGQSLHRDIARRHDAYLYGKPT